MAREFDELVPFLALSHSSSAAEASTSESVRASTSRKAGEDVCLAHVKALLIQQQQQKKEKDKAKARSPRRKKKDAEPTGQQLLLRRVVRFSFAAEEADELSIHVGDVVEVLIVGEPDGWWRGRIRHEPAAAEAGTDTGNQLVVEDGVSYRVGNFPVPYTEELLDTAAAPAKAAPRARPTANSSAAAAAAAATVLLQDEPPSRYGTLRKKVKVKKPKS